MKAPLNTARLFIEILAAIAAAEVAVIFILPMVTQGAAGILAALLGAAMLAILAGPVILWRMRAAVKKSERSVSTEVAADGWRLKLGVVTVLARWLGGSGVVAGKMHQPIRAEVHARPEVLTVKAINAVHKCLNRFTHRLNGIRGLYLANKFVVLGGLQALMIARTSDCVMPSWPTNNVYRSTARSASRSTFWSPRWIRLKSYRISTPGLTPTRSIARHSACSYNAQCIFSFIWQH